MSFTEQALRRKNTKVAGDRVAVPSKDLLQGKIPNVGKKDASAVANDGLLLDLLDEIRHDWKVTGTRRSRGITV